MSELGLSSVVEADFSLVPGLEERVLSVKFSGNADMAAVRKLRDYLERLHAEAKALSVEEVAFDWRELYFMNSSCFKSFVSWIEIVATSRPPPYRIRFVGNSKLHWQKRSLAAMQRLADQVVSIEP